MVHRKSSRINRFVSTLLKRLLKLLLLILVVLFILFLRISLTREHRAAVLEIPENPQPPPQRAPDTLRLLTYNIAHGRGPALGAKNTDGGNAAEKRERLVRIGQEIESLGADIVFLQEVDFNCWWSHNMDQAAIIAEAAGFEIIARQRNIDTGLPVFRRYDFGNALLSRLPISEVKRLKFPAYSELEAIFAGNHDGLIAKVQLSEEEAVLVVGLHLEVRSEDIRVEAAAEIIGLQRETSLPMLLMGDLNSTPPGMPDAQTSAVGQNAVELLESFGEFQRRPIRGQGSHHHFTFPSEAPRRKIDWILPDRNWRIQEYRILHGMKQSDHLPVLSTVRKR
ncbi:endonuclease/exonuclease/phosphatase family protein [Kiritimatiellaeota bacterium B1221]|nr:endonuclease/exonuclease/phosphatase family protein [Kiritimatiellaeota bacterium B1221]